MDRIIIHSDMNSCYASIECSLNPELKGKPVAVGGNEENRHGIILAKSEQAKRFGVKTGEPLWQARQKCPDLIIVEPHFDQYKKFSKAAHEIYLRYTDRIEPMGLDEVWCDLTGSMKIFSSPYVIIDEIRESFKNELGITVSIGLSFNKIFAKLGSDMAKRDAFFEISREKFKSIVWPLSVGSIFGIGKKTAQKLNSYGITTVGQLAKCNESWLRAIFGIMGSEMWLNANGMNTSSVSFADFKEPVKSIGHGITCKADLENDEEVWHVFLSLSQTVTKKLKSESLQAAAVQICVRNNRFETSQFQCPLDESTQSAFLIAKKATELFKENYSWAHPIRALTVRAINLCDENISEQLHFGFDYEKIKKQKIIDDTMLKLREKFGDEAIMNCCLLNESKIPKNVNEEKVTPKFKA